MVRSPSLCILAFASALAAGAAKADDKPAGRGGEARPKKLLLLGQSPDGHPKTTHEYVAGLKILSALLAKTGELEVVELKADEPWHEGPEALRTADGAVVFLAEGAKWLNSEPRRLDAFAQLAQRGGGLVVLHWGMGTREAKNIDAFVRLFGACHGGPDRKYQVLETELEPTEHPIAGSIKPLRAKDEFYYRLKLPEPADEVKPVLKAQIDGRAETVAWAYERADGGRSFGFSGLHFHENWKLESYRRLVAQGALWTMRLPLPEGGLDVTIDEKLLLLDEGNQP
jgi:hypothetical protein